MKKVELLFYKTNPSKENIGFKHVLFEIADREGNITHDWGFAYWNVDDWDSVEVPEGYQSKVVAWANTVNPDIVLNESKIIKI